MTARLGIINIARNCLGELPVVTEDLADMNLQSMINLYEINKKSMLSMADWSFAMKWLKLQKSAETPVNTNYKYCYNIPANLVKLLATNPMKLDYEMVTGNKLYCNIDSDLFIKYVFEANEDEFPFYFQQALAYRVAADSAMLITQNVTIFQIWESKAEKSMADAEYLNAIAEPSTKILDNEMLESRYVGVY